MFGTLYVRTATSEGLRAFAARLMALLAVKPGEVRESANYPPSGEYVLGTALGLTIEVCDADDSEFPDYRYQLSFRPETGSSSIDPTSLDGLSDIVARKLASSGFQIVRPLGVGRIGEPWMLYTPKPKVVAGEPDFEVQRFEST